jgi:hypothetical protein
VPLIIGGRTIVMLQIAVEYEGSDSITPAPG